MDAIQKIAKILHCSSETLQNLEKRMSEVTGKTDVFDKIIKENERRIEEVFRILGIKESATAEEIFDALTSKIEADDYELAKNFRNPLSLEIDCVKVHKAIEGASGYPSGFFLKMEKAREFLLKEPPYATINALGYRNAEELLAKENILEIYASLRFLESNEWMHNVFFKQYENLKPSDFEERPIVCGYLDKKWVEAATKFIAKKYHNISHLKELGFIFVIPLELNVSGEFLRNFSLMLHYIHEVKFYSDIIKGFAKDEATFAKNLISALRGDLPAYYEEKDEKKIRWLIIQRYLAKENPLDSRLFAPHLNSETIHWDKAENVLAEISLVAGGGLDFWKDLNWVGDYFPVGRKNNYIMFPSGSSEELIGFNLVDTAMSLVMEKEMVKYLYHHQEALWNKIFIEYFGKDELEKMIKENWLKGYIEI